MPQNHLIVISNYPPLGLTHSQQSVGAASSTKNTLVNLPNTQSIVLADIQEGEKVTTSEGHVQINRIWKRNDFFLPLQIIHALKTLPPHPILLVFEVAMFGNPLSNLVVPLVLFYAKIKNQKVITVMHQVIDDFSQLSEHTGLSQTSLKTVFLTLLIKQFFYLVGLLSSKVIVFEEYLKLKLTGLGLDPNKIAVIPHGAQILPLNKIIKKNKVFTVTLFGYLAWYKGTHWLANIIKKYPDIQLILAGGPNPNHLAKKYYQEYLSNLNNLVKTSQNISLTGFVPQDQIDRIYQSSDLIIFPYLAGMSSSGPLSLAFSYQRPVLLSQKLAPLLLTSDIQANTKKAKLNLDDIVFQLNETDLLNKINSLKHNAVLRNKIRLFGKLNTASRNWKSLAHLYHQVLFKQHV